MEIPEKRNTRPKITIYTFVFLRGMTEGFFMLIGPFLPEQMKAKGIDNAYFTPIFV